METSVPASSEPAEPDPDATEGHQSLSLGHPPQDRATLQPSVGSATPGGLLVAPFTPQSVLV